MGLFTRSRPPKRTPQQLGYLIAGALHTAFTQESIAVEQRAQADAAQIPLDVLWCEMLALSGFSAQWEMVTRLRGTALLDQLMEGFRDRWREFASQGERKRGAALAFAQREKYYADAAIDWEFQTPGIIGNPLSDAFTTALQQSAGVDPNTEFARLRQISMLAAMLAPVLFETGQRATIEVLREAGHFPA